MPEQKGEFDEAIDSYRYAIQFNPDYTDAYNNIGNALNEKGELDKAISSYKQALNLNPHYLNSWRNMFFALRLVKPRSLWFEELFPILQKRNAPKSLEIQASLLKYRLNVGSPIAESSLNDAINLIVTYKSASVHNPKPNITKNRAKFSSAKKVVALLHLGRSGIGLLYGQIHGHPQVSTLLSIYLSFLMLLSEKKSLREAGMECQIGLLTCIQYYLIRLVVSLFIIWVKKRG